MPPSTLFCMVVTGKLLLTLRTAKLCSIWVLDVHLDLFGWNVQFDTGDDPRGGQSKDILIEFFVLNCCGFLSRTIVPSPTKIPDGP
jgi:hypothetical protein